jgi:dTMP kinase
MTYGITPVLAGVVLAVLTTVVDSIHRSTGQSPFNPTHIALYFDALTFLATALTVFFGIKEISGRRVDRTGQKPSLWREFIGGWAYVGKTPLVRGLVLGILGAFAGAGIVVGTAKPYAQSLGGGDSTFYLLFAILFVGLAIGIALGPRLVGALSRRRWFGLSIMLAALSVAILAFAWHLALAVVAGIGVGVGAGMAFLAGTTLLGREVGDDIRGRVFSFIQTGTQLTLLFTVSVSSVLVGLGGSPRVGGIQISTTRLLLLAAGAFGVFAGLTALRQMDDKKGVPIFRDLWSSVRGRPLSPPDQSARHGVFVVFEGGEGAGTSRSGCARTGTRWWSPGNRARPRSVPGSVGSCWTSGRRTARISPRAPRPCCTRPTGPITWPPWYAPRWAGATWSSATGTWTRRWRTRGPAVLSRSTR